VENTGFVRSLRCGQHTRDKEEDGPIIEKSLTNVRMGLLSFCYWNIGR
jgi:hypothetical protein